MHLKQHLIMALLSFFGWLVFLLIGLPSNYYLDYSITTKIMVIICTFLFFIPPATYLLLKLFKNVNLFSASLYFSVYATFGIFCLDLLYCGIYLGYGFGFVQSFWPQSIFYILPWIEIPFIGYILEKKSGRA